MTQDVSTWQEVALVASPALAAIAAAASWASVLQARRLAKEETLPSLQIQLTAFPDRTVGAVITNAGAGVARGTQIFLTHGSYFVAGPVGHGFMFPGDTKLVRTSIYVIDPDEKTLAIASCRDRNSFPHAWNSHEHHRAFKTWRRRPRYQTLEAIFGAFYPDVELEGFDETQMVVTDEPTS